MKLIPVIFVLIVSITNAQSVSTLIGARPAGMGYTSSALFDPWGFFNNPAGIASVNEMTAAAGYDVSSALPGADRAAFLFSAPFKIGVAGIGAFRFGDELYNESMLSGGFSNQFGLASLGIRINYIQYKAEGFGSKGVLSVNFGGIAELTEQLSVGAYITNLNQPEVSRDGERLPTILNAGLAFTPTEKIFITTEIQKDLEYDPTWKAGLEYAFHPKFFVRTGFNLKPNASFFGLGFKTSRLTIDYALQYSSSFRFNHQASVNYQVTRK